MNILRNIIFNKYSVIPIMLILITNSCKLFFPDDDTEQPTTFRIAFLKDRDTSNASTFDNDLWIMDMDGSNQTQLTSDINISTYVFSPNGERICLITEPYDFNYISNNYSDLYLLNGDGSDLQKLTSGDRYIYEPFFTSDGERLAFYSELESLYYTDIFTMNIDGSDQTNITNTDSISEMIYDVKVDDSQLLIKVIESEIKQDLYFIDFDGTNKICITSDIVDFGTHSAKLTSTNDQIVFQSVLRSVDIIDGDGQNHQQLFHYEPGQDVWEINISPNDEFIAFMLNNGTHDNGVAIQNIYRINIDGSNEMNLTDSLGSAFYPNISNDGEYITFSSSRYKTAEIYIMDSSGENIKFLTEGTRSKFQPISN